MSRGSTSKELIQKQWDNLKVELHSKPENKGKELHHIWGRIGVLKCCRLLIRPITKKQHDDYTYLAWLRLQTQATKNAVLNQYSKYAGCIIYFEGCEDCMMYKGKQDDNRKG